MTSRQRGVSQACLMLIGIAWLLQATAQDSDAPPAPPDWYQNEIRSLTAGEGLWRTDNAEYQSDQERYDHYAMEWKPVGGTSVWGATGRLWGEADGEASADFWTYRIYWNFGSGEAVMQQFSPTGSVGIGNLVGFGEATLSDQEFINPDGSGWRGLHHAWYEEEDQIHVTRSFRWEEGSWQPQRTYRWQRIDGAR